MRRGLAAALVAILTAVPLPAEAQLHTSTGFAQFRSWSFQCTSGAFQACASLSVGLDYTSSGPIAGVETYTLATLAISNLQGAYDWLPDPGPYGVLGPRLRGMSVDRAGYAGTSDRQFRPTSAETVGVAGGWSDWAAYVDWDRSLMILGGESGLTGQTWGCDGPLAGYPSSQAWTCRGAWVLDFTVPGHWSFNDDTLADIGFTAESGGGSCTLGVDCVNAVPVPEPSTYVLMLAGLVGLGALIYLRRREALA